MRTSPASYTHIFRIFRRSLSQIKVLFCPTKIVTWPDMCRLTKEETTQWEHGLSHQ